MSKELKISELAFVIWARSHNPSLLNPDFLRINGIVDKEWVVYYPTFSGEYNSQIVYKNGISISLKPDRLVFAQPINDDFSETKIFLKDLALNYLKTLPHVNYIALDINPISFVLFDSEEEVENYIYNNLLRPGDWKHYQDSKLDISSNFIYSFTDYFVRITLEKVIRVDTEDLDKKNFGLLLSGNVHRKFVLDNSSEERLKPLLERVNLWAEDVNSYLSIIKNCLLKDIK